jgi:hypothetical protein
MLYGIKKKCGRCMYSKYNSLVRLKQLRCERLKGGTGRGRKRERI